MSPDGRRAVVCGFDPIGEVFELATGKHATFEAKVDFAGCAFLPDGRLITVADEIAIRDPATLAVTQRFALPARANSLAQDGRGKVAVTAVDGTLWLWSSAGEPITVATHAPLGGTMAFDRSGKVLYQNGNDQVVRAFSVDAPTAAPREIYRDARSHLATVLTSPEGDRVAIGMWDVDGARHSRVLDAVHPGEVELDGNIEAWAGGSAWAVIERVGPLSIADVVTAGTVLPLAAHGAEATSLVIGDRLASASRDGPAFLWDLASGDTTGMLLGHSGELVAISVRGDTILTASHDGSARLWSATDGSARAVLRGERELTAAVWQDDRTVVVGDLGGHLRTYEARTGKLLDERDLGSPISALAASPDGTHLAIGTLDGGLRDRERVIVHTAGAVTALAYSADGSRLYSSHVDGTTRAWDPETGAPIATRAEAEPVDTPADHEGDVALIASGDALLAVRPAGTTRVLAAGDLAVRATLEGRVVAVRGGRQVRALGDGTLLVTDGASDRRLVGHRAAITAAALSPDGTQLASASVDGTVRLWAATGAEPPIVVISPLGLGTPTAVAFAGTTLVIGFSSGGVRTVPTTPEGALARACRIIVRFDRAADVAPYCK
ncbi:MAG: WD40 repeat domain-containing protein [Myxococcales bacterium]|nr:WD40 repeat domain-containing protein [Myxococcales bacterium]